MELHDLGHQRARPGIDRRPVAADRSDARQPPDGGRDPRSLGRPGPPLRRFVRRDPGRASHLPHVCRRGGRLGRTRACGPDPDLVRRRWCALDRRGPRGGIGSDRALARRPGSRLRSAPGHLLGSRPPTADRRRVGGRHRPLRRALSALRDHRAGRVDRRHRYDHLRARPRPVAGGGLRACLPLHRGDVVVVFQLRRADRPAAARAFSATARSSPATPTPTSTRRSSPG